MWSAKRVVVGCAYALATVCASQVADAVSHDILGEGDVVRISVFQNPDLTTEARISGHGAINFPLIGEVIIGGLAPSDAEARIAQQLSRGKFVVRPQVNLTVLQVRSRQVSVLGQVGRPGRYPLDDVGNNLIDVLALAGGITPGGDDNVVVMLNRNGKPSRTSVDVPAMYRSGDMSQNLRLENGDVIYVERAPQFYIYGEVQHAGAFRLEPDMTVMQAEGAGTLRGLQIHRRMPDGQIQDLGSVRLTDVVQPNDVILVRERLF